MIQVYPTTSALHEGGTGVPVALKPTHWPRRREGTSLLHISTGGQLYHPFNEDFAKRFHLDGNPRPKNPHRVIASAKT
jgi:hypothetical protein